MSRLYRLLYRVGKTPWERMPELAAAAQVSRMLDREEAGGAPPYGRALDLGCGSGIWTIELATRGWEVTGIDNIPKAVRRARRARTGSGRRRSLHRGRRDGAAGRGRGLRLPARAGLRDRPWTVAGPARGCRARGQCGHSRRRDLAHVRDRTGAKGSAAARGGPSGDRGRLPGVDGDRRGSPRWVRAARGVQESAPALVSAPARMRARRWRPWRTTR